MFAGYLLASGLHDAEARILPESEALLVVAFVALAAPASSGSARKTQTT